MAEGNPLSTLDSLFLWGERPDTMMHVAGLLEFEPPEGADITYLRDLVDDAIGQGHVEPPWNRKLRKPGLLRSPTQTWVTDHNIDLDYHVRRSALPSPGSARELGVLISRLHSHPLDLRRPPWELHFIEGLENGRFALYVKIHHSLVDGYSAMKLLTNALSLTADEIKPIFFSAPMPKRTRKEIEPAGIVNGVVKLAESATTHAGSAITLGRRVVAPVFGSDPALATGLDAPHSILNGRIGRNRRFATQQYSLPELRHLGSENNATLNDVFLSVVGGGLHKWLGEMGELPTKSLIAFLPVNVRPKDDVGGGNAVGAILAHVGSNVRDPLERLGRVSASTRAAKAQLEGMTKQGILAYSAYVMAPTGLQALGALTGLGGARMPTNFNLCVSNVPGPRHDLYLSGSRLAASYPVSIPFHSMALNVTLQGYADTIGVGFVGCRDTLPHLQRLAVYTGEALDELRQATASRTPAPTQG